MHTIYLGAGQPSEEAQKRYEKRVYEDYKLKALIKQAVREVLAEIKITKTT
jgi:methylmalonyl-CoA mutase cobalamin-binding subunit